jgi:hypothetical protein
MSKLRIHLLAVLLLSLVHNVVANIDSDGDGLSDSVETNTGVYVSGTETGTNPINPDSDGDGVPDGLEISEATDPNSGDDFNPFSVNVIAYFPFNGNAIDESGSSFDLAAKNGASLATGKDGDSSGAYAFDGQDDYLEASGSFGDTTSLTISLWVNPASLNTGSGQDIFNDSTRANGNDVRISLRQGNILSGRSDKGSDSDINRSLTSSAADPGKWTHVVYTASEDGPSSIYFNGVYSGGSETGGRNVGYHSPLRLGLSEWDNHPFHGKIDSVRYYERVLLADEVLQLYQSEKNTSWTVPGTINYQGRLTDGNSDPVTGNVSMNLKLFDAATGGSELYSENIGTVTLDENGVYSFQFGAGGIAGVLTSANSHWLELSIDGTAQSPRERILSVPFAQIAGSVPDGSITSSKLAPGAAATNLKTGGLRIVRGSGEPDGTLSQGEGFTAVRSAVGRYDVTFDEAFLSNPTVVVTSDIDGSRNQHAGASISNLTPNGFQIRTNQTDTSPLSFDAKWHFIAIGQ